MITNEQINYLRIALVLSGIVGATNSICETILMTQEMMAKKGGKFSIKDACKIEEFIRQKYNPEPVKEEK